MPYERCLTWGLAQLVGTLLSLIAVATDGRRVRPESRGDAHTFDLIKLFTYPHMPAGSFTGAHEGRGTERERWHSARRREFNDAQGGWGGVEEASDQQGLANESVRREASCSFWLRRKRAPEQVAPPGASGATEERKKTTTIKEAVWTVLPHFNSPPPPLRLALITSPSVIMHKYTSK